MEQNGRRAGGRKILRRFRRQKRRAAEDFSNLKIYTGHRSKDGGREDMKAEENSKEITERVKCFGRRKKEMNRDLPGSQRREYTAKKRRIAIGTTIGVVLLVILVGYRILPKSSEIGSSGVFETQTVEKTANRSCRSSVTENLTICRIWQSIR